MTSYKMVQVGSRFCRRTEFLKSVRLNVPTNLSLQATAIISTSCASIMSRASMTVTLPPKIGPFFELGIGLYVLAPLFGPRNVRKTPFPFLSSLASQ